MAPTAPRPPDAPLLGQEGNVLDSRNATRVRFDYSIQALIGAHERNARQTGQLMSTKIERSPLDFHGITASRGSG